MSRRMVEDNEDLMALTRIYLVQMYPKTSALSWLKTDFNKTLDQFLTNFDADLVQDDKGRYQLTPEAYERYSLNLEHSCDKVSRYKETA